MPVKVASGSLVSGLGADLKGESGDAAHWYKSFLDGAIVMAINFHLASGANHPWLIPKEGFDETIDVDAVLVMFQAALLAFSGYALMLRRRHRRQPAVTVSDVPAGP